MTAGEEPEPLGTGGASSARRPRRWVPWVAAGATALLLLGGVSWRAAVLDSDGDGLTDRVESNGWQGLAGEVYRTSPDRADTDGDGLTDADEAGPLTTDEQGGDRYAALSDPLVADTDADGLADGGEADSGLDARNPDVDGDTLLDGYELDAIGTDPESIDTDDDGLDDAYEDANRESQGLDPVRFDEEISALDYAEDFLKGAIAGEFMPEDSLAWLAGNLVSGALGPSDLRDAVGSAINGDWVGSGFSALGVLPFGDVAAIASKAARFLERHPKLAARAATMIMKAGFIPDSVKVVAARAIWPDWNRLVAGGADEKSLLALQKGGTDLAALARAQERAGHVRGPALKATDKRREAVKAFVKAFVTTYADANEEPEQQARLATEGCPECSGIRLVDLLDGGTAHTVKAGYVTLTEQVKRQILTDAWLLSTGVIDAAHWHFVMSARTLTLGADDRVLALLDEAGIDYTVHLPVQG